MWFAPFRIEMFDLLLFDSKSRDLLLLAPESWDLSLFTSKKRDLLLPKSGSLDSLRLDWCSHAIRPSWSWNHEVCFFSSHNHAIRSSSLRNYAICSSSLQNHAIRAPLPWSHEILSSPRREDVICSFSTCDQAIFLSPLRNHATCFSVHQNYAISSFPHGEITQFAPLRIKIVQLDSLCVGAKWFVSFQFVILWLCVVIPWLAVLIFIKNAENSKNFPLNSYKLWCDFLCSIFGPLVYEFMLAEIFLPPRFFIYFSFKINICRNRFLFLIVRWIWT